MSLAPADDAFSSGLIGTIAGWLRRKEALPVKEFDAWLEDVLRHDPHLFSPCRFVFTAGRP